MYWVLDLDLSGSRDVISHVTIRFLGSHFLYVLHYHQVAIFNRFRDTGPKAYWGHDLDLSGSRRSRGLLIPRYPFPIGALLSPCRYLRPFSRYWPLSVLGVTCEILTFRGPGDQGVWKVAIFLQKAHPCVNPRRLSHFVSKLVGGLTPEPRGEKRQKVSDSHRNDVSPLTQGLRYRAACDKPSYGLFCFKFRCHGNKSHPG